MKKSLLALVITPILGAVLGYLLSEIINNGWLSSNWQKIETPPSEVHRLVAVRKGSLWVEGESGVIYYSENPFSCKAACWQEVTELPSPPIVEFHERSVTDTPCAPSPPLNMVVAEISECRRETWIDRNSTFVLRNDGSIYLWQVDLAQEWSAMLMILTVCVGAITLFIPTLIVVGFGWLSNRSREKQRKRISTAA